jgi:hypothetical protein
MPVVFEAPGVMHQASFRKVLKLRGARPNGGQRSAPQPHFHSRIALKIVPQKRRRRRLPRPISLDSFERSFA